MPDDRFLHRRAGHSEKVNLLTDLEYRVWTQFLLSADDFGVMRGTHLPLQDDNDHLANRPAKVVRRCLDALVTCGLLRRFEHQGKPYVYQHDWQDWQKVNYPRATTLPKPPAAALEQCDEATKRLFMLHPGGAGRRRDGLPSSVTGTSQERSENVLETVVESLPLMRAGAPAKRLTANGRRLTANGLEGSAEGNTISSRFERFWACYPRKIGKDAALGVWNRLQPDNDLTDLMIARVLEQCRSRQWLRDGGEYIPHPRTWLSQGRWKDGPADSVPQMSDSTVNLIKGAEDFIRGSH